MWRGRRALTFLLTPEEVGQRLHLKKRAVLALDLPRVRVGAGRGKILFREDDVELYIRAHVEHKGESHAGRVQKRQKALGLSGLPSRDQLQKIRLAHQGGGETGGSGVPH